MSSNFRLATGFEYAMLEQLTVKLGTYATHFIVPCIGLDVHWSRFEYLSKWRNAPSVGIKLQTVCEIQILKKTL
ncbi:MAG: hypothetical protein QM751_02860 [Paludibacteraceae bacterium]